MYTVVQKLHPFILLWILQGSVAAVHRWDGKINNCCVANFRNCSKWKTVKFFLDRSVVIMPVMPSTFNKEIES